MSGVDEDDVELPASIAAAWGLRGPPTKGPKPALSAERIVEAAIELALSDGLGAVSMSRVAASLSSSTMSLYRYVAAKDELLALMVDTALGDPPEAPEDEDGWRDGLSRWAWAYHDALCRHPWVLGIPISGPPITPRQTAWLEYGLEALRNTGLAEGQKLSVILLLSGYVRNEATLMSDLGAASASAGGEIMPRWGRLLARVTSADMFPALHAALASGAFDQDDDPDDEFVFGLHRILDGIDVLVLGRPPPADRAGATRSARSRR